MARKTMVKDYDQFQLRLPPGMRDRIREKASRAGMSMNEAIVWCLEHHFPAPTTVEDKLSELAEMVAILKGDNTYEAVDLLVSEVHDVIVDIYNKGAKSPPNFQEAVAKRFDQWKEWEAEHAAELSFDPFEDQNWPEGWSGDDIGSGPDDAVFDDPSKKP